MSEEIKLHNPPRMRGIKQAIAELRQMDADTALTERALRRLILTHEIPSVRVGKKYLVNMEILTVFLYRGSCNNELPVTGGIRRIKE